MTEAADNSGYLVGQMLIAMPQMQDPRFERTVIYLCAHTEDGAMGLVINKLLDEVTFPDLLEQLDIDTGIDEDMIQVHFGGPVEAGRGFVLHSADYMQESTLVVSDQFGMTATIDILKAIAEGDGPRRSLLALGYAGWGPGQLEDEIQQNGWLCVSADEALIFGPGVGDRWQQAMAKLGIDINMLSGDAGHA
jgi:putative transcriptional regulator